MADEGCTHPARQLIGVLKNGRLIYYCPDCKITYGVGGS